MQPAIQMHDEPIDAPPSLQWVDLQDDLLTACNDLERLHGLLSSAASELSDAMHRANATVARHESGILAGPAAEMLPPLKAELARFITAMQFDDMASQLITHTRQLLRSRADRIAAEAFGDDGDSVLLEPPPLRPNPVTQDEMDAGSVELF
jgi:hypothetical protein